MLRFSYFSCLHLNYHEIIIKVLGPDLFRASAHRTYQRVWDILLAWIGIQNCHIFFLKDLFQYQHVYFHFTKSAWPQQCVWLSAQGQGQRLHSYSFDGMTHYIRQFSRAVNINRSVVGRSSGEITRGMNRWSTDFQSSETLPKDILMADTWHYAFVKIPQNSITHTHTQNNINCLSIKMYKCWFISGNKCTTIEEETV